MPELCGKRPRAKCQALRAESRVPDEPTVIALDSTEVVYIRFNTDRWSPMATTADACNSQVSSVAHGANTTADREKAAAVSAAAWSPASLDRRQRAVLRS